MIDKKRQEYEPYCSTCIHRDKAGDMFPCSCCYPVGLLYHKHKFEEVFMPKPDRYDKKAVMLKHNLKEPQAEKIIKYRRAKDQIRRAVTFEELKEAALNLASTISPDPDDQEQR